LPNWVKSDFLAKQDWLCREDNLSKSSPWGKPEKLKPREKTERFIRP
jgi:hypothetical protein